MAVLEGRHKQRDWTCLATATPKKLGVALFCWQCWLAATMGAFLSDPSGISTATTTFDAAAILLQPLSKYIAPAALATASAKPNPIADRAEQHTVHGCQHPLRARHDDSFWCGTARPTSQ